MSDRTSSPERALPGWGVLSLDVLVGPVIALLNQQAIYAADTWACGFGTHTSLHVIPLLALVIALGAAIGSYRHWGQSGRHFDDEAEARVAIVRFLSILGLAISVFSALVIIAQWGSIFTFGACARA